MDEAAAVNTSPYLQAMRKESESSIDSRGASSEAGYNQRFAMGQE